MQRDEENTAREGVRTINLRKIACCEVTRKSSREYGCY